MLFTLLFVLISLAFPLYVDIQKNGSNNILTKSKNEMLDLIVVKKSIKLFHTTIIAVKYFSAIASIGGLLYALIQIIRLINRLFF